MAGHIPHYNRPGRRRYLTSSSHHWCTADCRCNRRRYRRWLADSRRHRRIAVRPDNIRSRRPAHSGSRLLPANRFGRANSTTCWLGIMRGRQGRRTRRWCSIDRWHSKRRCRALSHSKRHRGRFPLSTTGFPRTRGRRDNRGHSHSTVRCPGTHLACRPGLAGSRQSRRSRRRTRSAPPRRDTWLGNRWPTPDCRTLSCQSGSRC